MLFVSLSDKIMVKSQDDCLPSFRQLHGAIVAAPPPPRGFPLAMLNDPSELAPLRAAPYLQQFLKEVRLEAARARSTPLDPLPFHLFHLFETSGERLAYELPYFDRRRRLAALALDIAVNQEDANLPALADLIWEICNEYTWALPAHLPVGLAAVEAYRVSPKQGVDLFAAHTAHALAEVLALLGKRLDPWLHYRVHSEVEQRVFQPLFYDTRHFDWESARMNWSAVCAGCAGMAALVLEDDRERLAGMIDRVIRSLECFLEGFGDDGGCPEGIDYWDYGFGFYFYFAEMLSDFTQGRLDLLQGERIRRIASFARIVSLGQGRYINYSDAAETATVHPGLGSRIIARTEQSIPYLVEPSFHSDDCYRWGHITRDLAWTEAGLLHIPVTDGSFYLPDLAWVIDRRVWDHATVAFSAKGGRNDEPHNHNDLGHFILHLNGENLLADLGAGVYTRQYFGEQRYDDIHTGSQGHSVPLINGHTQCAGEDYYATVIRHECDDERVRFAVDLTHAYADVGLTSFVRSFDWTVDPTSHSARLRLTDTFSFTSSPAVVQECFISLTPPRIGNSLAVWQGEHATITMHFDQDEFEAILETFETMSHQGDSTTVYRLRLDARREILRREDAFVLDCRLGLLADTGNV